VSRYERLWREVVALRRCREMLRNRRLFVIDLIAELLVGEVWSSIVEGVYVDWRAIAVYLVSNADGLDNNSSGCVKVVV
jgi:hypothetical protein